MPDVRIMGYATLLGAKFRQTTAAQQPELKLSLRSLRMKVWVNIPILGCYADRFDPPPACPRYDGVRSSAVFCRPGGVLEDNCRRHDSHQEPGRAGQHCREGFSVTTYKQPWPVGEARCCSAAKMKSRNKCHVI